jgi:hypothetical protein
VRMILLVEDLLIRENVLPSDFVFAICRDKKLAKAAGRSNLGHTKNERRFVGYIDLFDGKIVTGWAADVRAPTIPVRVEIHIDDRLQATMSSDAFRQDLKDAGYGDGRKGFSLSLVSSPPGRVAKLLLAESRQVLAKRVCDVR